MIYSPPRRIDTAGRNMDHFKHLQYPNYFPSYLEYEISALRCKIKESLSVPKPQIDSKLGRCDAEDQISF